MSGVTDTAWKGSVASRSSSSSTVRKHVGTSYPKASRKWRSIVLRSALRSSSPLSKKTFPVWM